MPRRRLTMRDLERARQLRTQIRALFEAATDDQAAGLVNALLVDAPVALRLEPGDVAGGWALRPVPSATDPVDRLRLMAAGDLAAVIAQGRFHDLKTCEAAPCRDAFVDESRNGSRRFCCLACANRHRVAAFRRRTATETEGRRGQA